MGNKQVQNTGTGNTEEVKKVPGFILFILWAAFFMFLSLSIPHLAWVFHQFEGTESKIVTLGKVQIDLLWIECYGVALGIDATVAALAYLLQLGLNSGFTKGIVWAFTVALSGLSWYLNYLFDMAHKPIQASVWNIGIAGGLTTTGYATPLVTSAVPVFLVAYTFIIDIVGNKKQVSLEDLQKEVEEKKKLSAVKKELKDLNRSNLVNSIKGAVSSVAEVATYTAEKFTSTDEDVNPQAEAHTTAAAETVNTPEVENTQPVKVAQPGEEAEEVNTQPVETVNPHTVNTDALQMPLEAILGPVKFTGSVPPTPVLEETLRASAAHTEQVTHTVHEEVAAPTQTALKVYKRRVAVKN